MEQDDQTLVLPDNDYFDQQLLLHGETSEDILPLHHLSSDELEERLSSLSQKLLCLVQDSDVQDTSLARWLVEAEQQLRRREPEKEVRRVCRFVAISHWLV